MSYEIILAPEAIGDLGRLGAKDRSLVKRMLEIHLRHEPARLSKSRIKRLRELSHPQFRLRIGEYRVFYDVTGESVRVLAIVTKDEVNEWLSRKGEPQ